MAALRANPVIFDISTDYFQSSVASERHHYDVSIFVSIILTIVHSAIYPNGVFT
jgi:hypothetical protein